MKRLLACVVIGSLSIAVLQPALAQQQGDDSAKAAEDAARRAEEDVKKALERADALKKAAADLVNTMLENGVKAARLRMKMAPPMLWLWSDLLDALDKHHVPCFLPGLSF